MKIDHLDVAPSYLRRSMQGYFHQQQDSKNS